MSDWRQGLSRTDQAVLDEIAGRVKAHLSGALEPLYLAGRELQKSRAVLKEEHRWIDWLETTFRPGWRTTAWRLMTLAERLEKPHRQGLLSQFATSAAYELCKPSAPEAALEQACAEAERGEEISPTRAKEIVQEQREQQRQAAAGALAGLPPAQQESIRRKASQQAEREEQEAMLRSGLSRLRQARDSFAGLRARKAVAVIAAIDQALELAGKLSC